MTATSILPGGYEAPIQIELTADALAPGSAVPYEFHVNERVSELFRAEVFCACEEDASVASDLIGQDAQLSFVLSNETPRLVHGVVTEVEEWHDGAGHYKKRMRVVIRPHLWQLSLGRNSPRRRRSRRKTMGPKKTRSKTTRPKIPRPRTLRPRTLRRPPKLPTLALP